MSGDIVKSSVKLPVFDGQEKHFSNWITKYKAYARFNGFSELLVEEKPHALGARENDPSHQDGSENAEALRLFRLNSLAVANLTCAFTNDNHACLGFVQDGMTTEWPNGAAWLIMKRLYKRYKPTDLMTKVELNRRLGAVKLAAKESPGSIFTQLAAIRTWYSKEIPEEKILPAIIQALPKDYKLVATQYSLMKSRQLTTDTLEDLEEMLIALWRSLGGTHGSSEDGDTAGEMGLGSFEGTCYKCKGKGHKANACPQQTNKFQGKCNLCGRNGHKKADCYEDEANASKRPKNWKSKLNRSGTSDSNYATDPNNRKSVVRVGGSRSVQFTFPILGPLTRISLILVAIGFLMTVSTTQITLSLKFICLLGTSIRFMSLAFTFITRALKGTKSHFSSRVTVFTTPVSPTQGSPQSN